MDNQQVSIEIELDEDLQFQLMRMAHERDITLNQLINQILTEFIQAHPVESLPEKKTSWTVTIEQDPNNPDECIIPLPPDLLDLQGWSEGDTLDWSDNKDGTWSLTKI
jgi:hypothetical protein